jgi:cystinosin
MYSKNIPVGIEDVIFSVHAVIITTATLAQCVVYERGGQRFFTALGTGAVVAAGGVAACFLVVATAEQGTMLSLAPWLTWLNLLMLLSSIKLVVSLIKYIPQVGIQRSCSVARRNLHSQHAEVCSVIFLLAWLRGV